MQINSEASHATLVTLGRAGHGCRVGAEAGTAEH